MPCRQYFKRVIIWTKPSNSTFHIKFYKDLGKQHQIHEIFNYTNQGGKNLRIEKTNRDSKKLVLLQHKSNTHISIPRLKNKKKKTPIVLSSHKIFPTYAFFFHHLLYIPFLESFIDDYHT